VVSGPPSYSDRCLWALTSLHAAQIRFRGDAATDLLEHAEQLLDSDGSHPAATVMLAGAGWKKVLRALCVKGRVSVAQPPSLSKYAAAFRKAQLLSARDEKQPL
jgi:hypothetical protein